MGKRIKHLYEKMNMTVGEFASVLYDVATGEMVGTEKFDGYNVKLTFDGEEIKYARNINQMKSGGLDLDEFLETLKFEGFKSAIKNANANLNFIFKQMNRGDRTFVFRDTFFNCEVICSKHPVIIPYDRSGVIFHRNTAYDSRAGATISDSSLHRKLSILEDFLEGANMPKGYLVQVNKIIHLPRPKTPTLMSDTLSRFKYLREQFGLHEASTLEDLYVQSAEDRIEDSFNVENGAYAESIARFILGLSYNKESFRVFSQDYPAVYQEIIINKVRMKHDAMKPVTEIVDFLVNSMALGRKNDFISDPVRAISGIKAKAVKTRVNVNKIKDKRLRRIGIGIYNRLGNPDKLLGVTEGFVFQHNGEIFKIVTYIPLLSKIDALIQKDSDHSHVDYSNVQNLAEGNCPYSGQTVMLPGAFKPPHMGHFHAIEKFASSPEIGRIIIFIGDKSRGENDEFGAETSKMMFEQYYIPNMTNSDKVWLEMVKGNPLHAAYRYAQNAKNGEHISLVASDKGKDYERVLEFKQNLSEGGKYYNPNAVIDIMEDKTNVAATRYNGRNDEFEGHPVSSTIMRGDVLRGDERNFKTNLPINLREKSGEILQKMRENIIRTHKTPIKKNVQMPPEDPEKKSFTKKMLEEEVEKEVIRQFTSGEYLEEMSSMAGGAVAGPVVGDDDGKKQKLRKYVQGIIRETYAKINKLRESILKEIQRVSTQPSTGMNILEDLLKKVIPTLENGFKSLTTSEMQRKSYRSHIVNAVWNSILTSDSVAMNDESVNSEEGESSDENIKFNDNGEDLDINDEDLLGEADINPEDAGPEAVKPDQNKFIDINQSTESSDKDKKKKGQQRPISDPKDEDAEDKFSIPGEDETGRNVALNAYKQVEPIIIDMYLLLTNEEDKSIFREYLITNLKLYFDKFEDELQQTVNEPSSESYDELSSNEVPTSAEDNSSSLDELGI